MKAATFGFVDDEVYPAGASALGINAYHIHACPVLGQSQPYCACLKRLDKFEAGEAFAMGDSETYRDCKRAWGGPACTAFTMRTEEHKAGKALYFINRQKLNEYNGLIATDRQTARQMLAESVSRPAPTPTQPVKVNAPPARPEKVAPLLQADYASAINAELQTLSSPAPVVQSTPVEATTTRPAMLPGESPLEYIRRIKAGESK